MFKTEEYAEALFDSEAFVYLLEQVQFATGARSFVAGWFDRTGAHDVMVHSDRWSPEFIREYSLNWADRDPWILAQLVDFIPNRARNMANLVSEKEYAASEIYNELFRPIGDDTFHAMSLPAQSRSGTGGLALHRGKGQAPFGARDLAALRSVERPLAKLLEAHSQVATLKAQNMSLQSGFEQLGHAVFFVRPDGLLVETNKAGEEVLRCGQPLSLSDGRLCCKHPANERALAAGLATVMRSDQSAVHTVVLLSSGQLPTSLSIYRLPASSSAAVMCVLPIALLERHAGKLVGAFGLTPTEADVALRLSAGADAKAIAVERGTTIGTTRLQLARIAEKMGCSRQAQVVAIVLGVTGS